MAYRDNSSTINRLPLNKFSICFLVLLTSFISACNNSSGENEDEAKDGKKEGKRATLITAHTVKAITLEKTAVSFGKISSKNAPVISAEVSGSIISIEKRIGESVKKGETLAKVDPEIAQLNFRSAKANLERSKTMLANQERIKNRSAQLLEKGFISQARFDDISDQHTMARQQVTQATAQMETTQEQLSRTSIRAPLDGNVIERMISVGDFVAPGKPIFKLSTSGKLQVILLFPETLVQQFKNGQLVRLSTPTNPDSKIEGEITDIISMIDTSNRSVKLVVEVDNPGDWKPGASVSGEVVLETKPNAIVVPAPAVVLRPAGNVVYVITNNTANQRKVKIGQRSNGMLEILSGIKAEEIVANDGAGFLADQAPVQIK